MSRSTLERRLGRLERGHAKANPPPRLCPACATLRATGDLVGACVVLPDLDDPSMGTVICKRCSGCHRGRLESTGSMQWRLRDAALSGWPDEV